MNLADSRRDPAWRWPCYLIHDVCIIFSTFIGIIYKKACLKLQRFKILRFNKLCYQYWLTGCIQGQYGNGTCYHVTSGGWGGTPTHIFPTWKNKKWQNLHNGVGIPSMSMTDLWADKPTKKGEKDKGFIFSTTSMMIQIVAILMITLYLWSQIAFNFFILGLILFKFLLIKFIVLNFSIKYVQYMYLEMSEHSDFLQFFYIFFLNT